MVYIAVQVILFYLMLLIGLNLTFKDLLRIKQYPYLVIVLTVAQFSILPVLAYLLILLFEPQQYIAVGMMLVSICPSGALSNFYSLLGKADAALSLTLTAVSSLVSVFLLPFILMFFYSNIIMNSSELSGLATTQVIQLGSTLLFPVLLGILMRWKFDSKVIPLLPKLEKLGFIGLLLLISGIIIKNIEGIGGHLVSLVAIATAFTVLAMLLALLLCKLAKLDTKKTIAVAFEFPVRNVAVASIVAINVFDRSDYLLFSALFILIQTPLMLGLVFWGRSKSYHSA